MNTKYLSSYQDPEGELRDRLTPRTDMRKSMITCKRGNEAWSYESCWG